MKPPVPAHLGPIPHWAPTKTPSARFTSNARFLTIPAPHACIALLPLVPSSCRFYADAPGGQPEYRSALAPSFLFKFFVATSSALAALAPTEAPTPPVIAASDASAGDSWLSEKKNTPQGEQRYPHASYPGSESQPKGSKHSWAIEGDRAIEPPPKLEVDEAAKVAAASAAVVAAAGGGKPPLAKSGAASAGVRGVGESLPHVAGFLHATGEAEYADDARAPPGTLNAWLVRAERAPALLAAVDATKAQNAEGVAGVFFASDLPAGGLNSIGPIAKDELCFAEKEVLYVGQVRKELPERRPCACPMRPLTCRHCAR